MRFKFKYFWLLLFVPLVFVIWFLNHKNENKPNHYLPYFGPKYAVKASDTSYHSVPDFTFTNQYNKTVSQKDLTGKIYVCEYFFTTCQSICPIMNNNLERVYKTFKERKDFLILSHTVDPETDSVAALKAYAEMHGAVNGNWLFLTGSKKDLYDIARKGYLLDAGEGNGSDEDFIHTQNFALIDKEKHIRGFYDGTDSIEVERLIKDTELLFHEYEYKNRNAD